MCQYTFLARHRLFNSLRAAHSVAESVLAVVRRDKQSSLTLEFELAGVLGTDFIELEVELVELLDKGVSMLRNEISII